MRKRWLVILLVLAFISILWSGGCNNSINRKNLESNDNIQATPSGASSNPEGQEDVQSPESGPVSTVPWENDDAFKNKQAESGAVIQMAAYRTVLRDPLPGEEQNVHLAAQILKGTVLQPGQVFSQNRVIGPYDRSRGFQKGPVYIGSQLKTTIGGGVCKMASTLYNVAVLCDLSVIERHAHGMPVPYVPYGQDATVAYGDKDFQFRNTLSSPILIWAQGVDNILYVAFYGQTTPPQIQWHHEFLSKQTAPRIYHQNSNLPAGEEKVVSQGMDGAVVRSWVTITYPDGTSAAKPMGKSYYTPMPCIIEKRSVSSAGL